MRFGLAFHGDYALWWFQARANRRSASLGSIQTVLMLPRVPCARLPALFLPALRIRARAALPQSTTDDWLSYCLSPVPPALPPSARLEKSASAGMSDWRSCRGSIVSMRKMLYLLYSRINTIVLMRHCDILLVLMLGTPACLPLGPSRPAQRRPVRRGIPAAGRREGLVAAGGARPRRPLRGRPEGRRRRCGRRYCCGDSERGACAELDGLPHAGPAGARRARHGDTADSERATVRFQVSGWRESWRDATRGRWLAG